MYKSFLLLIIKLLIFNCLFSKDNKDSIFVLGVGDMMLGTNYPSNNYLPPFDGLYIFDSVKEILKNSDVTFGNLEGVILSGKGKPKQCANPSVCYIFKSPDHYANYFKNAGFNLLSLANNHSGDFGIIGRTNTINILKSLDINFAGVEGYEYKIFKINNIKIGFCAFAPNKGTISIHDDNRIKKIINYLNINSDIVLVSFHGGAEGQKNRHLTNNTENYFGENRGNPIKFAHNTIDYGADIVFGHGPHVTRAIELYKNKFIAYSLGNFLTYGRFNLKGSAGIAPIIKILVSKDGNFMSGEIFSIKQIEKGIPVLDNDKKALKEIIELTNSDIINNNLVIELNGKISKKN